MVDLKMLQAKQLEIMDAIHKVCGDNNITYYLIAGSCLGAVRHGGIIPWDVDIDIAMPRDDYEHFFRIAGNSLPNTMDVHTYLTDEAFLKPHGLVCLKDTVLLSKSDLDNPQIPNFGIFIDVFPLDKCPNNPNLQTKHKNDYLRIGKLKKIKFSPIYKENTFLVKVVKHLCRLVLKPLSVRTINRWQQNVMMRYSNLEPCNLWCSMASKYKYEKQLMPKDYYGKPQLIKFEDREFYIPEQPEKYLTKLYGDYMKLPSKDEQEKLRNYFIKVGFKL